MSQSKKNKLKRLKRLKKSMISSIEDRWKKSVEEDLKEYPDYPNIPDIDRKRKIMIGAFKRLHEYEKNIKRDPNDPKWEYSSEEKF